MTQGEVLTGLVAISLVAVASCRTLQALRERDRAALVLQQERDRLEAVFAERTAEPRNSHYNLERLIAECRVALEGANRRLQDLSGHL